MDPDSRLLPTQLPEHDNFTTERITGESVVRERDAITFFIMPVLITFVVLGFIGNVIILHAVCAVKRFHRAQNLMLASLSAASVANMISTISMYTQTTYSLSFYGPLYCKFFTGVHCFMLPAEGFTMVCISLERTQGVSFPLMRATKASTMKKIGAIWCLALLLDLPCGFFFYEYDPAIESFLKCRNTKQILGMWTPYVVYTTTNYSFTYLLPSLWLARALNKLLEYPLFTQFIVDWIRLVSQFRFLVACQALPLQNEYRKRQKELIGHAIIFTSIFIAVKVPVGTHFFLYRLPPELLSETVVGWVKTWKRFFFSVSSLHGCFYPFIIFSLSRDIRKYLFCCERNPRHPPVPPYRIT